MQLYVDVALPLGVNKLFTYIVPDELHTNAQRGSRVLVPFGRKTAVGLIVRCSTTAKFPRLKHVYDIIDNTPILPDELFRLTEWISEYYFAPLGDVLKAALPQGFAQISKRSVSPTPSLTESTLDAVRRQSPKRAEILSYLMRKGQCRLTHLKSRFGVNNIHSTMAALAELGYVTISEDLALRVPKPKGERVIQITSEAKTKWAAWLAGVPVSGGKQSRPKQVSLIETLIQTEEGMLAVKELLKRTGISRTVLNGLIEKGIIDTTEREVHRESSYEMYDAALGAKDVVLAHAQEEAVRKIHRAIAESSYQTFLLHGITGSGKTQVYIEAIRKVRTLGRSAIVLVPEISLTPQIVRRFKYHFGGEVAVLHSQMSPGERYDTWRSLREGRRSIAIGPRSAIFAPLAHLGLIIVDEEQESSYKQYDQSPRYHARDVAIVRARNTHSVVILGSATPSLESYHNAREGKYTLLELPERVDNAKLPRVEIVDMVEERKRVLAQRREARKQEFIEDPIAARSRPGRSLDPTMISEVLREKIAGRLEKREGIILFHNRRGFAPFVECQDCGHVEMCDHCNITMTFHLSKRHLRCHYCGSVRTPPDLCPQCRGIELRLLGIGTQRVEEELHTLFPSANIVRMDLDTTSRKGSHDRILRKFAEDEIDILLGTQMVAKGLDFNRVTLVGVVSADTQLLLPDFRSAERTFQLLTQVAGRAGRSGTLKGEVIIQTSQPEHYSVRHATTHDYGGFYQEEITYRRELNYPPYSRLVLIEVRGDRENEVQRHAEQFAKLIATLKGGGLISLGPAPAAILKLKNAYRWHLILKSLKSMDPSASMLHRVLAEALRSYESSPLSRNRKVKIIVDIDPVGML